MVWGLFPVDPIPGEHEYFIFSKGKYTVGRKGCDLIIVKDKGVSRIHAEVIVDEMICMDDLVVKSLSGSCKVRIRDCSKYGTFVNKNLDSRVKVHEFSNKETTLKDGDIVSFGTGNANYRFCFVPLVFFACSFKASELKKLKDKASLIGARVSRSWTEECTHVVVDDGVCVNDEIVDAIVGKKPFVRCSWIELIAGKSICTEMRSYLLHTPSLALEGVFVKVTDPDSRGRCLEGYTFLLESIDKYKFSKLHLLLEVSGGKVLYVDTLGPSQQNLGDRLVCVIPSGLTSSGKSFCNFNSPRKVKEMEIISAVFSGHLDPAILKSAPVLVTSSCSTDETVVADSDLEVETATSIDTSPAVNLMESAPNEGSGNMAAHTEKFSVQKYSTEVHIIESEEQDVKESQPEINTVEYESQGFVHLNRATLKSDSSYSPVIKSDVKLPLTRDKTDGFVAQKDLHEASESGNIDVIYSQDLIVRDSSLPQSVYSSPDGIPNFKGFRKISAPSGNSFDNLIRFSKSPYQESDCGDDKVAQSVKEEKKRKEMEAIAEDLFNSEKGRRRAATGPLKSLFARG